MHWIVLLKTFWHEGLLPHSLSADLMLALPELGSDLRPWPFCCGLKWRLCLPGYLCSSLKPNPCIYKCAYVSKFDWDDKFSTRLHWLFLISIKWSAHKVTVIDLWRILSVQIRFGQLLVFWNVLTVEFQFRVVSGAGLIYSNIRFICQCRKTPETSSSPYCSLK